MEQTNPSNVKNFRRRIHINLGTVVFGLVFLYILCSVILYFTRNRVSIYEVTAGTIVENQTYSGLVLRQEHVYFADSSGYLTLLAHEGSRVSPRSPVYAASESSLTDMLEERMDGNETLTADDYKVLYNNVSGFQNSYSPNVFQEVYSFKSDFNSSILDSFHGAAYSEDEDAYADMGIHNAAESGIVVYCSDGFESVTYENFTSDMLNKTTYSAEDFKEKETIRSGDPVYKLITDEPWEIIINIDETQRKRYEDDDYVEIRFMKDQTTAWAQISKFEQDGDWFCRLKFTNSMVRFATDRYLDVEVLLESTNGLKVPNSAIVEKNFYTVPVEFLVIDNDENTIGFYVYEVDKNGKTSETYQEITPYNLTDTEAYLNMEDYKEGTTIVKKGTTELYTIQKTGQLIGVYNVNKGYADFSIVTMQYQNDDYSIIKPNESYGLAQYDHIVLDGSSVNDEETIYQ